MCSKVSIAWKFDPSRIYELQQESAKHIDMTYEERSGQIRKRGFSEQTASHIWYG